MAEPKPVLPRAGLLAEFQSAEALVAATRALVASGVSRLEAYTPYPVPEVEDAMHLPRSAVGRRAFIAGVIGAAFAYWLQYYLAAVDYPVNIASFPAHSGPAFIPITFETTVLFASLTAFFSFFALSSLPRLWHPLFEVPAFASATIDRFWLEIDPGDARFDEARCTDVLTRHGATRIIRAAEPTP